MKNCDDSKLEKPMNTANICFNIFFSRPLGFPSMLENNVIA